MDRNKAGKKEPFPKENASFLSLLTFSYLLKFIHKGRNREIETDDLYDIMSTFKSETLGNRFENYWKNKKTDKKNGRTIESIISCFGMNLLLLFIGQLIVRLIYLHLFPKAVGLFVSYFDRSQTQISKNFAFRYAGFIVLLTFLKGLWNEHYDLWKMELSMKVQIALSSSLYRKILRLSEHTIGEISSGRIVTILTKDVLLLGDAIYFGVEFILEIFHVILVCYLLYRNVGVGSSIGVGVMIISLIIQIGVYSIIYVKRGECNEKTDYRLSQTEQVLSFVKCIKMFGWESFFTDRITKVRRIELSYLQSINIWKSLSIVVGVTSGSIVQLSIYLCSTHLGNPLNADLVYYVQQLLQLVIVNTIYISTGIKTMAGLVVAVNRIDNILNSEENCAVFEEDPHRAMKSEVTGVRDRILKSGLNILIGPTNSGKSTLLKAIISQCNHENTGSIIPRKLCYASQIPWLFPSSLKQNIVFGEPFNEGKYKNVLNVCCLAYDLNILGNDDETILTDRGSNLSQGQKTRINLARALYRDSDIYLLDDCLASLDTRTVNHVFNHAIRKYLRSKICVLVTHRCDYLEQADNVIIMQDKTIKHIGQSVNTASEVLQHIENNENDNMVIIDDEHENEENPFNNEEMNESTILLPKDNENEPNNIYSEKKETGRVNFNCYKGYFEFGGGLIMAVNLICLHIICEVSSGIGQKLMSKWVNNFVSDGTNGTTNVNDSLVDLGRTKYMEKNIHSLRETLDLRAERTREQIQFSELIAEDTFIWYVVVMVVSTVFIVIRYITSYCYSTKVSKNIHKSMFANILHGSMTFFDKHLIGNIVARFSKDIFNIDEVIPFFLVEGTKILFYIPSCLLLISSVNLTFGILAVAFIVSYSILCDYILSTTRSLQRISTSTLSPILGRINTSLEGVTVIRVHERQKILIDEFDRYLDIHFSSIHTSAITIKFFCFWLECFGSIFLLFCAVILLHIDTGLLAGDVGLVIYQSTLLHVFLHHFLVSVIITENMMTSMERVIEYTNIPQESQNGEVLQLWPYEGSIIFHNVSLTYRIKQGPILKNLNFKICPQEKIGIVGRTGAGKSSIISVLLRMYDFVGDIMIDNVNIRTLSLEFLRTSINIISQEPFLFSGTIRMNIDPEHLMSDAQVWNTLEKVNLQSSFESLDEDLEEIKLSIGQKQLLCIGRALNKKSKIFILDEATASMDDEMDSFVQERLNDLFEFSTVIIVAHRLHTVMKCDKIIVVDKGELAEFDTPENLLRNKNSLFFKMVHQKRKL